MAKSIIKGIVVKAVNERRIPMRTLRNLNGSIPRYMNVPRNINEISKVRSSLYTFSVAAGDVTSMVPGKFMPKIRNNSLQIARALGDFNALQKTYARAMGQDVAGGFGQRFLRRTTGRWAGSIVRRVPGDNPASRMLRSRMGAQFQRGQNKLFKTGTKSVQVKGRAQINGPKANHYIGNKYEDFLFKFATDFATEVQRYTPIKTGALIRSIKVSNKNLSSKENEIAVTMGDETAFYAPAVEYGRGAGYEGTFPALGKTEEHPSGSMAGRLSNYKGFQPARAPLRKGAISITAKYRGRLKETSGIKSTAIASHLRSSVKGVFG